VSERAGSQPPDPGAALRIDKWLWHARFFKSRSQASAFCGEGKVRLNRRHIERASAPVRIGDVLTFPLGHAIRVVRVEALGRRRGPPAEARTLYTDLVPGGAPEPSAGPEPLSPR
jgi:ribosome-associated heat shock protein Hsp15